MWNLKNQVTSAHVKTGKSFGLFCPPLEERTNRRSCCLKPEKPPRRPDPGIYSQQERFQTGQTVTWDSPDITTNLTGGVDEHVVVNVRNYATDAPALGTLVKLDYSPFGIGFPRTLLNALITNLNKAGATGSEQSLRFDVSPRLREEMRNIAVFVSVSHPHDKNINNNVGEQAWSASGAAKGAAAQFRFPIYNALGVTTTFNLMPMSGDWGALLDRPSVTLLPGQSVDITLTVNVPSNASGSKHFQVVALRGGSLFGGVHHRFDIG